MKNKLKLIFSLFLSAVISGLSMHALAQPADAPISQAERKEVLQTLDVKLQANYVFPDVAERIRKALKDKAAKNGYATAASSAAFAAELSKDLREQGNDKHFMVFHDPRFHVQENPNAVPSAEEMERQRVDAANMAYGIEKLQRLPGNVGYLELRGFGPTELVAAAYTSALSLLGGTDALILDLRRNDGGSPSSVAFLMSHFFTKGDERHLNDIYDRPTNTTQQFWTSSSVGERYSKPVYVLTSARTFSGGEECAYDFQTQKRATLVGETTGGGANPGNRFSLGHGLVVNIPTGRAINPVTHANWEHIGVKPDIAVAAAQAQQTAYMEILRSLLAKNTDPEERDDLQRILLLAEKGESPTPTYKPRR
ncbi:S41 family peptidase [Undibacterium terreum]|uniref:Interphotoreceptor retinoid-binding protein n=1 Tax=Undibacterium terreum TaxID=1224302 RepID=A0A916XFD2_9BURK|nr:S41 family peptidase [Undibacterium terreum]GGC69280.1 interphotoreceptor retinoid-binding protein [Undibacterium terreum]